MGENLSEDPLSEILCRLPIKRMVAFKCVSKAWNILISDVCVPRILRQLAPLSGFVFHAKNIHNPMVERYPNYVSCSYFDGSVKAATSASDDNGFVESYSSLLPSEYSPYDLIDCCNGLILLTSRSVPRYFVCNPETKQCVAIPKSPDHVQCLDAALAFNPDESLYYKVVCFLNGPNCSVAKRSGLDIFYSETRKWIRCWLVINRPEVYGVTWVKRSVYSAGMMYKVAISNHLLYFDLEALTGRAIELPYTERSGALGFIGVSKGVLHYANRDRSMIRIWHFDLHLKRRYFWILKHCVSINNLATKHPEGWNLLMYRNSHTLMPYAIHPTSDIIFIGIPKMMFTYHLKIGKLELFCKRPEDEEIAWGQCSLYPYSRCYIMLDDFNKMPCNSS